MQMYYRRFRNKISTFWASNNLEFVVAPLPHHTKSSKTEKLYCEGSGAMSVPNPMEWKQLIFFRNYNTPTEPTSIQYYARRIKWSFFSHKISLLMGGCTPEKYTKNRKLWAHTHIFHFSGDFPCRVVLKVLLLYTPHSGEFQGRNDHFILREY